MKNIESQRKPIIDEKLGMAINGVIVAKTKGPNNPEVPSTMRRLVELISQHPNSDDLIQLLKERESIR
jgi:hypothetical protein